MNLVLNIFKMKNPIRKKRQMYTYTEDEVKKLCWQLINAFTNPEIDLKDPIKGFKEDFEGWFKQNKK